MTKSSIVSAGRRGLLFFIFFVALFTAGAANQTSLFAETAADNQTIMIAFPGVELKTFIQIMNTYLGKTFFIPQNFSGTVTIYSAKPIPIKELEAFFYSVLSASGFTVVPGQGGLNIIKPLAEAKGSNIEVNVGSDTEQLIAFGDKTITQIIPLSYSKAEVLAPFLQKFAKSGNVDSDPKTNTLIVTDTATNISKLLQMVKRLDVPAPPSQETIHTYPLQNTNALEMAGVLTQAMAQKGRTLRPGEIAEQVSITASPSSNDLIITANPETYDGLVKIITNLDRRPSQVLIEALVVEVSGSLVKEFGVQWQFLEPANGAYRGFGAVGGTIDAATLAAIATGTTPAGLIAGVIQGNKFPFNIGALIKLYGANTNFKILSNPQITTMDNKEATIAVVNTIPYSTGITYNTTSTTNSAITSPAQQSFSYQDVGIKLKITPHISEDRHVRLEVNEEVTKLVSSSVSSAGTSVLAPTTAKRSATSSVIVNDRETLVLGGLTSNNSDETREKVPVFGDIPLLGNLFRHTTKQTDQTSLYIFITPTVITTKEEAAAVTVQKKDDLKNTDKVK